MKLEEKHKQIKKIPKKKNNKVIKSIKNMKIKNPCAIQHDFKNVIHFNNMFICQRCKKEIPSTEIFEKLIMLLSK